MFRRARLPSKPKAHTQAPVRRQCPRVHGHKLSLGRLRGRATSPSKTAPPSTPTSASTRRSSCPFGSSSAQTSGKDEDSNRSASSSPRRSLDDQCAVPAPRSLYRRSLYRRSASRVACTSSSVTTNPSGVSATSAPFRPTNLTSRPTGVTKSRDAFTGQLDLRTCRQDAISGEFARSERANSPLWCSSRCRTCAVQPSAPRARSAIARRASEAASSLSPPPPSPSPVLTEL